MPFAGMALAGSQIAGNAAGGVLQFASNLITSAISILSRGLLALGSLITGAVVGGFVALVTALRSATTSAMAFSRSVIDLRNAAGMSTGAAQGMANRFGAFGIGPGELSNGGRYHGLTAMMARMYGVDPSDPASINARAQSFGSGFLGHAMRRSMLGSIGLDTDNGRFLAGLPQERVREQLGYQNRIQGALGITPETMRKFAEDLPLVTSRIGMVVDAIKMKFAAVALPFVEKALGRVADYLAKNSDAIGRAIERAGKWLTEDLPQYILKGAISFLTGAGYFLKGLSEFTRNMIQHVPAVLGVLDAIYNGFLNFVGMVGGAVNVLLQAGQRLGIRGAVPFAPAGTGAPAGGSTTPTGAAPSPWDMAREGVDIYNDISNPYSGGRGTYQNGFWDTAARIGSRIAARAPQILGRAGKAAARTGRVAKGVAQVGAVGAAGYGLYQVGGLFEGAGGTFDAGRNAVAGQLTPSNLAGDDELIARIAGALQGVSQASGNGGDRLLEMAAKLEAMLQELKQVNQHSKETATNTRETSQKIGPFKNDVYARVLSYISEDALLFNLGG